MNTDCATCAALALSCEEQGRKIAELTRELRAANERCAARSIELHELRAVVQRGLGLLAGEPEGETP